MVTFSSVLAVGIGGALGSVARFGVSQLLPWDGKGLPVATLAVNIIGCVILGAVSGADPRARGWPETWTFFLSVGICGGLTTFSTFSAESATLIEAGRPLGAALYVVGSTVVGMSGYLAGAWVSRRLLL